MAEEVMRAHKRGDVRATALRSSDYYGPGVLGSALGERVFGSLVSGKNAQVGRADDKLHSFACIEDVGRAPVTLGVRDEALGRAWIGPHASAWTQIAVVEQARELLWIEPRMTTISPLMMRLAGLFVPGAKASAEMMYEFMELFVVDSSRMEKVFGLKPTPMEAGLTRTMDWYKTHFGD